LCFWRDPLTRLPRILQLPFPASSCVDSQCLPVREHPEPFPPFEAVFLLFLFEFPTLNDFFKEPISCVAFFTLILHPFLSSCSPFKLDFDPSIYDDPRLILSVFFPPPFLFDTCSPLPFTLLTSASAPPLLPSVMGPLILLLVRGAKSLVSSLTSVSVPLAVNASRLCLSFS